MKYYVVFESFPFDKRKYGSFVTDVEDLACLLWSLWKYSKLKLTKDEFADARMYRFIYTTNIIDFIKIINIYNSVDLWELWDELEYSRSNKFDLNKKELWLVEFYDEYNIRTMKRDAKIGIHNMFLNYEIYIWLDYNALYDIRSSNIKEAKINLIEIHKKYKERTVLINELVNIKRFKELKQFKSINDFLSKYS